MNLKKLEEINQVASQECSIVFSKLLKEPVVVTPYYTLIQELKEIPKMIEVTPPYIQITTPIVADAEGITILILAKKPAFFLADILFNLKLGTTQEFTIEHKAALEEVANIITGCYLSAFSKCLGIKNISHQVSTLAVKNSMDIDHPLPISEEMVPLAALLFGFKQTVVKGYVIILFKKKTLEKAVGGALI